MKLNKNDLRKIMYDFNCISNRLLQANIDDYNGVLAKFLRFIMNTEIIKNYIECCGVCTQNMEEEFNAVLSGYSIFDLGDTDEEEVRNIFSILSYAVENEICVSRSVGFPYSNSTKFQDCLNAFNDRVTKVLIFHIENYLTKLGIDMGVDDKVVYNITAKDGQINIANDNSVINATNSPSNIDMNKFEQIIKEIIAESMKSNLSEEDMEIISDSLEILKAEIHNKNPRKAYFSIATKGLKSIKGTAEFGAAVATLIQFLQSFNM